MIRFSILIVAHNNKKYTQHCLISIEQQTNKNFEIVVVENGSNEEERAAGKGFKTILLEKNYGFPFAVNLGAKACKSDWILVLNNDCELKENFVEEITQAVEKNPAGKVFSPKIYQMAKDKEKIIYSCGDDIDEKGLARNIGRGEEDKGQYDKVKTVPLACFACILIKKEILERFPLDESYFGYYEDVDFGLRLQKAKIPIFFAPNAICYHFGEASFSKLNRLDNEIRQFQNLSLTVAKHFSFSNIVRHYAIFNLKSFRYYFFMKKKWKFLLVERKIAKAFFQRLSKSTRFLVILVFLFLDWAAIHDILKGQEDALLEWLTIVSSIFFLGLIL